MARLFLSYRTLDEAAATIWHDGLVNDGHDVFMAALPEDGIPVGVDWEPRLYDELHRADAVVALVSAAYIESHWCFAELAISRARGVPVFPVSFESGLKHPMLQAVQHLDGSGDPAAARQRLRIRLRALDGPGGRVWSEERPAYRGLEPFDTNDAAIFFGRATDIENLTTAVCAPVARAQRRPLLVIGASGSGKSSVVRAGLVPAVARREGWLVVPPMFPGDAPADALAFQIARAMKQAGALVDGTAVRTRVRTDIGGLLADLAIGAGDVSSILLVVDQLEELVSRASREAAQDFLAMLEQAAATSTPDVRVVGTLRSDALSKLLELWARPSPFASHLLAPLGRAALADVIEGPARVAGLHVPPLLVSTLVEDTGDGSALPFLSFVLRELAAGQRRGGALTLERYQELGGVQQALIRQADAALADAEAAGLSRNEILRALTELVSIDDAGNLVRRRRPQAAFDERSRRGLDPFVVRRLLSVRTEGDETLIDVAHEAFIRAWPPLEEAIRGLSADLELRRDVERAASTWRRAGRADSYLWSGEGAVKAARLATLSDEDRQFVERSLAAARASAAGQADAIVSQVLLADLPSTEPATALALATAVATEIALTPRVVRCLHDALVWHEVESLVTSFEVPGILAAHLIASRDVVTVSTGVRWVPPRPASTRARLPGRRRDPEVPLRLFVDAWNVDDQSSRWRVPIDGEDVRRVASAVARIAVSTDAGVTMIETANGATVCTWRDSGPVLALSPDGQRAAVADGDALTVRDVTSGASVFLYKLGVAPLDAQFSADGGHVSCRYENGFYEWDITSGGTIGQSGESEVTWIPTRRVNGSLPREYRDRPGMVAGDLALGWGRNDLAIWTVRSPGPVIPVTPFKSSDAQASSDTPQSPVSGGRSLALTTRSPRRTFEGPPWRIATEGGPTVDLEIRYGPRGAAFSANGNWLIVCGLTFVEVRDATTGAIASRFGVHSDEEGDTYCAVAISDEGRWAATGSLVGRRSKLWDVEAGKAVRDVGGRRVAIDPAGRFVIAGRHGAAWVVHAAGEPGQVPLPSGVWPVKTPPVTDALDGRTQQIASFDADTYAPDATGLAVSDDGALAVIATTRWTVVCAMPDGEPLFAWRVESPVVQFMGTALLVSGIRESFVAAIPTPEAVLRAAIARVHDKLTVEERRRFGLPAV